MNSDELRAIDILDGGTEQEFDRVTGLVNRLLDCDVSTLSIIDESGDRQFFKAATGLRPPWSERRETPLSHSFCKSVITETGVVRVEDARQDSRFKDNPGIETLNVIAYLGVAVEAGPGRKIGSLCAISGAPREWSSEDEEILLTLAAGLSKTIELRFTLHQQRRAAKEFAALNDRFNDLAANVPGAIFRYLLHADGRDEVEYMSPGCFDIWEVPAEEIEGNPAKLWEMIEPDDLPGMQACIGRSAEQLSPWQHRWCVVTPSDKRKYLQGFGQPRALDDGSILWNSVILDVTVEVEAQEKLRDQDRLLAEAQKQEVIGRLAGGVAHDFNNLLAIIMSNAEELLTGDGGGDAQTYLSEIVQAAEHGSDLTKSLLSFAQRSDLHPVVIEVNTAIRETESLLQRVLPENVEVKTALSSALWRIETDRSALERALLNLAVNARDAMPDGGSLTIETANASVDQDQIAGQRLNLEPGDYVVLTLTDTGQGIESGLVDRVFEPFFSTKGPDKGTGLGLPMVLGFAKQSGGTVKISSRPGEGTSVRVYLRATVGGSAPETPAHTETAADPATGRVLVVEDNAAVRRSVTRMLKSVGYSIVEASSGDAAAALLDEVCESLDAVLTDVVMPGKLQGPDVVHKLRERRPGIPVIFLSGYPHEADVHGNGIEETHLTLMKPVRRAELLSALNSVLHRT